MAVDLMMQELGLGRFFDVDDDCELLVIMNDLTFDWLLRNDYFNCLVTDTVVSSFTFVDVAERDGKRAGHKAKQTEA